MILLITFLFPVSQYYDKHFNTMKLTVPKERLINKKL